jgi:extracellular elastinolytic metalloproteinase
MRKPLGILFVFALVAGVFVPGSSGALVGRDDAAGDGLFDIRAYTPAAGATLAQGEAIEALAAEMPSVTLRWNARFGTPSSILRHDGALSEASAGTPEAAARAWLERHAGLFGWSGLANLATVKTLTQPNGGPAAVLFHQRFGGLEGGSLGGSIDVALDRDNRVLSVRANVVRTPSLAKVHELSAREAFSAVSGVKAPKIAGHRNGWTVLERGPFAAPQYLRRVAFPVGAAGARPAWEVLFINRLAEGYRTVVDAETGMTMYRAPLAHFEAPEGRVFRNYPGAKGGGKHEMVSFAGDPVASPQGWLNPVSSTAPGITTIGNNASTAANWLAFIAPDGPGQLRPVTANGIFDFAFTDAWNTSNCGSNPISDATRTGDTPTYAMDALPAAVNLFYQHNVFHDFFYKLGFNELAGALQVNNFGKGGLQEDPLIGLVQAGAIAGDIPGAEVGRDNAYMLTLPDGLPSWSGMFLFETIPNGVYVPCADGDFDAQVIGHEFTHAVSTRWVGGEWGNLDQHQGGSMGEAWSDFYALHYLHKMGLETTTAMGPYVTGDPYRGIRNYPLAENPLGFGDIGYDIVGPEVHSDGEIWAATLWQIRTELAKAVANGADLAAQLIADAMPISGPTPDMLDMRNAILAAEKARTKGTHQSLLWRVFALRGMGASASSKDASDVDPVAAYESGVKADNGSVALTIMDQTTGAPIQGALISISNFEGGVASIGRTATDGTITLKLASNTYSLRIADKGYGARNIPLIVQGGGSVTRRIKLGINYASSGAGATIVSSTNQSSLGAPALAIDDREITTWRPSDADGPAEEGFVINLAGTAPVAVSEIRLSARPLAGTGRFPAIRDWEILSSLDGKTFTVLSKGSFNQHRWRPLASTLGYRSWKLKSPVQASFLKFVVKSAQSETAKSIQLAEIQVFGRGEALKVAPPADVSLTHHAEGTVLAPTADAQLSRNLILRAPGGAAQLPLPCPLPNLPTQGIDAYLFELPDGFGDGRHSVKVQLEPTVADPRGDPDVYFYTANCEETGTIAAAPELDNPPETGLIPQGTKYVLAQLYTTMPGTVVLDAASERVLIPKGKVATKPKPAVKGARLPATGVADGVAAGLTALMAAAGLAGWLRPRRRGTQ